MRKDIIILIVGLVIMVSGFYFKSKSNEPLVNFLTTTSSSTSTSTETVLAIGVVELVDTISVAAQSTGTVKEVYVNFNTSVKKGELLAKMDATAANAQVNQARNHLVAAQTNHETKRLRAQAQKKSYNHGAISQADYQIIQNEPKIAQLAVDTALLNLKIAEKKLIDLNIYAPENGIVLNRNINAGETIDSSAHAPTLFVIAKNLNKVRVRAQVVEQDIPFVEIGQEAVFTVVDIPNELFEGRVQSVSSQGTLISVLNPETGLIAGMKVNIIIYIGKKDNSLSVPNQ
jgi:HlyD family secretion protein